MKYRTLQVFPTTVLLSHVGEEITSEDRDLMVKSVDELYDMDSWDKDPLKPRYQTYAVLFKDSAPPIWQKLRQSFIDSCRLYINTVENFVNNPEQIDIHSVRAWCYKSNASTMPDKINPMHTHRPSFLSGVFYLKIPAGKNHTVGTEFGDPLGLPLGYTRDIIITNEESCWTIFPGWMPHRAKQIESEEWRYVIAADCYVAQI